MGRNLKIADVSKKHLTEEEKAVKKDAETKSTEGLKTLPTKPSMYLGKLAKAEYKRISKDLRKLPVRDLDRGVLELYCTWYGIHKEISERLESEGYVIDDETKGLIPNPLIQTLDKASANIRSSASQLGLTVDSRMKMFIPKNEEKKESIFDKFGS